MCRWDDIAGEGNMVNVQSVALQALQQGLGHRWVVFDHQDSHRHMVTRSRLANMPHPLPGHP